MNGPEPQSAASKLELRRFLRPLRWPLLLAVLVVIVCLRMEHVWRISDEQRCRKDLQLFCEELMIYPIPTEGHLPCAYLMDSNGRRMHSWRSCVIPFVDRDERSGSGHYYKFDEPWDSPANMWFRNETGFYEYYSCPVYAASSRNACYLCVVGGTLWPLPKIRNKDWNKPSLRTMREGGVFPSRGKALLLVEVKESDIPWTKPEDISLSEIVSLLRDDPSGDQFRRRIRHVVAVDAKGALHTLDPARDLEEIKAIVDAEKGNEVEGGDSEGKR